MRPGEVIEGLNPRSHVQGMPSTTPSETKQDRAGTAPLGEQGVPGSAPRGGVLALVDRLLSKPLRNAPPSELLRYRLMVGASLFVILISLPYSLTAPFFVARLATLVPVLGGVGALVLLRRTASPSAPALLLCASLAVGLVVTVFASPDPAGAIHAANVLLPAFAVYLLGPRLGLLLTLLLTLMLSGIYPAYYVSLHGNGPVQLSNAQFWSRYIFAGLSFLGVWGMGVLHSTARNEAQRTMERTLKELRESEGKLTQPHREHR